MFCTKCGNALREGARFCEMCGNPVQSIPAAPAAEEKPVAPQPAPMPEPVVEPVVAPVAEPVLESVVEPVVAPVAEPVLEPVVEPVVETVDEPVAEPVVEPVVEPMVEPVVEPVVEPEVAPLAEPVAEPVVAPVFEPAPAPVMEPAPAPQPAPVLPPQPPVGPVLPPETDKKKSKKIRTKRNKPHIVLRMLLQFLSFVLCIVLTASLLGTVVLADMNRIMSKGGIQQLVTAILSPNSAAQRITPAVGAVGVLLDDGGLKLPDDFDVSDIPEDILTGGDSQENIDNLVGWFYDQIAESSDQPLKVTEEQVQSFVENSTVSEYIAEKLAGYADDFINGTENTSITTEEIMAVLEENEALIEQEFNIEITGETRDNLEKSVDKIVVEKDLNGTIRQQVFTAVENAINEGAASTGMTWDEIQPMVQMLCADTTLYVAIGLCVVLMLLMCLLNFYNVPAGLTWISIPSILLGLIMTGALVALPMLPTLLDVPAMVVQVLSSFANLLMPIHAGLLGFGVALLIISIIWRIIRSAVRRKRGA